MLSTKYHKTPLNHIYVFPVPGSLAPPQWYGPPRTPPCQQLPISTYYYLLPTTNYYLPHTTPPHRGRGDWTMLLLLGYHDHGWGGTQNLEHIFHGIYGANIYQLIYTCYYSTWFPDIHDHHGTSIFTMAIPCFGVFLKSLGKPQASPWLSINQRHPWRLDEWGVQGGFPVRER